MLIFVYGTLKRGYCNNDLLSQSEFVGECKTLQRYPMVNKEGDFPYLIDNPGEGFQIKGELYRVDEKTLAELDYLEDCPNLYLRKPIDLILRGVPIRAQSYFVNADISYRQSELLEEF